MSKPLLVSPGQVFGRLTVDRPSEVLLRQNAWVFRCECGTEKSIRARTVVSGAVRSCGCLHLERCKSGLNRLKHGAARVGKVSRLHNIWRDILKRCKGNDPRYGGRGICVSPEWQTDFAAFQAWSKANGYDDSLTIDRIDNDGPYAPSNCRWADRKAQARNRRSSRFVTVDGRTQALAAWLEETGLTRGVFGGRVRRGASEQEALFPT